MEPVIDLNDLDGTGLIGDSRGRVVEDLGIFRGVDWGASVMPIFIRTMSTRCQQHVKEVSKKRGGLIRIMRSGCVSPSTQ